MAGEYKVRKVEGAEISIVETHRGLFMAVTGSSEDLGTILFQKHRTYTNFWVYRRSLVGRVDPEAAVTGHILSTWSEVDVLSELEKRLDGREKAYWKLLNENMKLKAQPKRKQKRKSKRG